MDYKKSYSIHFKASYFFFIFYFILLFVFICIERKFYLSVGFSGQNNLVTCGADLEQAKKVFTKK